MRARPSCCSLWRWRWRFTWSAENGGRTCWCTRLECFSWRCTAPRTGLCAPGLRLPDAPAGPRAVGRSSEAERRWRAALTVALAVYGWICLEHPGTYRWLDSLDLAIHETGHLVFAVGGETLTVLGGTLFQLLVPAAFAVALWRAGDRHGATVPLWWLGQNCWNVSVYVRDAQAQLLPLVGGGEHDWAFLLDHWGWLERDQAIGGAIFLVGVGLYVIAVVAGWKLLPAGS